MAFVPAANTVMAELRYIWNQQKVENTLYFYEGAGWTPASMSALAVELFNWWSANVKAQQSNQITLNEVYITDLASNTSPTHSYVPASGNVGSAAAASVPNNVALCISLRTGARGRSARGRNYVPAIPATNITANVWGAAVITAIEGAYQALASGSFPTQGQLSVVSRYENNAPRATAVVRPVISAVCVDNYADSQRRRLPGRGT